MNTYLLGSILATAVFFCLCMLMEIPSLKQQPNIVHVTNTNYTLNFSISNTREINIFLQSQTNNIILDIPHYQSHQIYYNYFNMFCNGCDFGPLWFMVRSLCANNLQFSMFIVGANYGGSVKNILSACLEQNTNLNPQIFAFEAIPQIFAKFNATIYRKFRQNSANLHTFNNALSDEYNKTVQVRSNLRGGGGVHSGYREDEMLPRGSVQTTTFDHILHDYHDNNIVDYVLIDVEGFEVNVVKGMKLESNSIKFPMIQVELGGTWVDKRHSTNWTQRHMAEYLESLGYDLFLLGGDKAWDFYIDKRYGFDIRGKSKLLRVYSDMFDVSIMRGDLGKCPIGQEYVQGNLLAVNIKYIRKEIKHVICKKLKELQLETFNHMKYVKYSQPNVFKKLM